MKRKMKFVVEVDASTHNAVLSNRPPTQDQIRRKIEHSIQEGQGYYPMFNYNTFVVRSI
jgi:hypothetical protein